VKPDHPEPGRAFEGDLVVQPPALLQGGDIVHVHLKMSAISHNGKKEGCEHDDDVHPCAGFSPLSRGAGRGDAGVS
jgi:hypothetical protein